MCDSKGKRKPRCLLLPFQWEEKGLIIEVAISSSFLFSQIIFEVNISKVDIHTWKSFDYGYMSKIGRKSYASARKHCNI